MMLTTLTRHRAPFLGSAVTRGPVCAKGFVAYPVERTRPAPEPAKGDQG
jgi:hypothetical protein